MNRLLLVRVGALGDTLMVTPSIRALKKKYPDAEIDFLCSESAMPLLELNPHITRLFCIRRRNLPFWLSLEKRRITAQLRSRNYDVAFLLETAPRYRQLLLHAKPRRISSFAERGFDPQKHCISNYLDVVGFPESESIEHQMELHVSHEDMAASDRLVGQLPNPRVGLQLGYGPRGKKNNQSEKLKGWRSDNFLHLSRLLVDRGANLIFTGSAEDQDDVQFILRQLPPNRVCTTAGKTTVRELATVLKKMDLFISVDTGPAHMAAALGVPLITLWGPAIYEQVRPISNISPVKILRVPPSCAPCYGTSRKNSCRQNICMENISPDLVMAAAEELLTGRATSWPKG